VSKVFKLTSVLELSDIIYKPSVVRIERPSFHPHGERLGKFQPDSEGLPNHWTRSQHPPFDHIAQGFDIHYDSG
jgi:hypothetical protein